MDHELATRQHLQALAASADESQLADITRAAALHFETRRTARIRRVRAGAAGVLVATMAICAYQFSQNAQTPEVDRSRLESGAVDLDGPRVGATGDRQTIPLPAKDGEPCFGARRVEDLEELPERARTTIWMPTSNATSPRELRGAWLCGSSTLLDFGSVDVSFSPGWEKVDTSVKFASLAEEDGGKVTMIDGRDVLVQPWQEGWTAGQAMMVVADVLVRVVGGPEVAPETLEEVMASIDVERPMGR